MSDIRKITKSTGTTLYTPKPAQVDQYGTPIKEIESLDVEICYINPWITKEDSGITLEFVPAYNINHLANVNWTGVIVDFGNLRIYHAGDTAHIPEMKQINCDIALIPILENGLISDEECVNVIESIKETSNLKYAIPMHFPYPVQIGNVTTGNLDEVEAFQENANCTVVILEPIF